MNFLILDFSNLQKSRQMVNEGKVYMEEQLFKKYYSQIKKILKKAYEAEYYKKLIDEVNIDVDSDFEYEDFKRIKFSTKHDYNINKFEMFTSGIEKFSKEEYLKNEDGYMKDAFLKNHGLQLKVTSGSTGQPLEVFKSNKDMDRDYLSLNIQRRKLTDYDFTGKFIWVWPVNPYTIKYFDMDCDVNEVRTVNKYGYQFFLYEHSDENFDKLYHALIDNKCEWMTSSPSVLFKLAEYISKYKLNPPALKYIECHSEKMYDWQKKTIVDVFSVVPVSIYSSNEIQFMGAVCEKGTLHLFSNTCFVEFIESQKTEAKEICVTSFNYTDVPVIRYKLGDCGDWNTETECNCKLHKYPSVNLSGFRTNDFLVTKNNTYMEPFVIVDSIFYLFCNFHSEFKQYKVIERDYDKFEYYLPKKVLEENNDAIIEFIQNYLTYILKYPVTVTTKAYEDEKSFSFGMKYRYFEVKLDGSEEK